MPTKTILPSFLNTFCHTHLRFLTLTPNRRIWLGCTIATLHLGHYHRMCTLRIHVGINWQLGADHWLYLIQAWLKWKGIVRAKVISFNWIMKESPTTPLSTKMAHYIFTHFTGWIHYQAFLHRYKSISDSL